MRILDRRRGPNPPKLVVVDPRTTDTAREADLHLAPRLGTNIPLLNGLIHLIIEAGRIDRDYIACHTVGFDRLAETVRGWPPERVADVTGIPVDRLAPRRRSWAGRVPWCRRSSKGSTSRCRGPPPPAR